MSSGKFLIESLNMKTRNRTPLSPAPPLQLAVALTCLLFLGFAEEVSARDLKLLFMGDSGPHQPAARFQELAPVMKTRGIELTYTDQMSDLKPETLSRYDGLVLYANIDRIERDQVNAVLEFVENGKGFIPLHCASYCWRNS